MPLTIIADGIEDDVNTTKVTLTCPVCEADFVVTSPDLLREASLNEDNEGYIKQARDEYISAYETSITCPDCELPFPVDFAYGEMQPARYKLGMYQTGEV